MILVNRIAAYGTASSSLVGDFIPAGSLELVILASQALRTQVPYTGGRSAVDAREGSPTITRASHCHSLSLSLAGFAVPLPE